MTQTEALFSNGTGKVALEFCKPGARPSFRATSKRRLRFLSIKVAYHRQHLCGAIDGRQPVDELTAPVRISIAAGWTERAVYQ